MSEHFMEVDPRRQREFIERLNRHLYNMRQQLEVLDSSLRALGRDWEDSQYVEFRERTLKTVRVLSEFLQEGRKISGELAKSAQLAEDYERTRL